MVYERGVEVEKGWYAYIVSMMLIALPSNDAVQTLPAVPIMGHGNAGGKTTTAIAPTADWSYLYGVEAHPVSPTVCSLV